MSLFDAFKYDGKRVVVVGAATGMGNAAARLVQDAGAAELIALDIAAVDIAGATTGTINLADRASIEAAAAAVEGPIHALLSCSGVADGTPGIEKINFLGHRLFIELLIDSGKLGKGATIGLISSAAGLGWDTDEHLAILKEYLAIEDFDAASEWALANGKGDYQWSKRAVNAYVATQAYPMLKRGIRINAILPGPTNTPLAQANADTWLTFGADYREDLGIEASTPEEQAYPLVFLCSDAGRSISGQTVISDAGLFASGLTDVFPSVSGITKFLSGRISLDDLMAAFAALAPETPAAE